METFDVAVVGRGLAGLAAAASAADAGARVVLVGSDDRGGRAATDDVGRFRFNRGAHAVFTGGAGAGVLRQLGVKVQSHRPRLRGTRLRVGDDVVSPFAVGPKREILGALVRCARSTPEGLATVSAAQWLDELDLSGEPRRFVELVLRTATYAADLSGISADAASQYLRLGFWPGVRYVDGGWGQIVDGLIQAGWDRGVRVVPHRARAVLPDGVRCVVDTGETDIVAKQVVLAAGAPGACASLLPEPPAAWNEVGPASLIACLDVGLPEDPRITLFLGLDRPLYLSRHFRGGVQLMRYLRPDEDPTPEHARAELVEHARLAGIEPDAAEACRYLHHLVACSALPAPEHGGMAGRPPVVTGIPGVLVAGDWVGPTGHLSDASLASGHRAGLAAATSATSATIAV